MKKRINRAGVVLLCLALLASLMAGCAASSSAPSSSAEQAPAAAAPEAEAASGAEAAPAPSAEPLQEGDYAPDDPYFVVAGKSPADIAGTLTVWTWDTNFFGMIEKMNTIYPNVTFDFVTVPGADYMLKLQSALASGGAVPDILCAEIANVGRFYDMDISDDIAAEPYSIDKNVLVPYLAEIGTDNNGKFFGIPNTAAPGALFYRRDLAKEYLGTDDPDEISSMLSTWDSFIEAGRKVTEASGGEVSMISGIDGLVHPLVDQTGLPWREGNKLLIEENFLETYQTLQRISEAGIDAGLDENSPAWNASFAQGNVLCHLGACWSQSFTIEVNDPEGSGRWGVASTPGGAYNWGGIWWCAYRDSKNKEAVAAWMRYETSPQGGRNKYQSIHFYPGLESAYEADYLYQPNEFFGGQNVTDAYLKTMDVMTVMRPLADDATFYNSMAFFTKNLAKGEGTPEELVVQIEDDIISQIPTYTK